MKTNIKTFYNSSRRNEETNIDPVLRTHEESHYSEIDDFKAWVTSYDYYTTQPRTVDNYKIYLSTPAILISDLISWWRDYITIFSRLIKITFNLLSIPAITAKCKRVFSQAKLTVSSQRNAINNVSLKTIQYIKN